jgi:hypothetical protein
MVRIKFELNETADEVEKIKSVTEEIKHDLENIYKK